MGTLRFVASAGLILFCVRGDVLDGSPERGHHSDSETPIAANSFVDFQETYQGGRRACVIVVTQNESPVTWKIEVFDASDQLQTSMERRVVAAVIWYPPRSGQYKIRIHNRSDSDGKCYIAWK